MGHGMNPTVEKAVVALLICLLVILPVREGVSAPGDPQSLNIPAELPAIKLKKRQNAFAISVESVLRKLKQKQEIILIDVRRKSEFEKFRIPGSINVPLYAVKTKTFLKAKPLVLVNEGYGYRQLEQECEHLRNSGFRAQLLNGGLYYWRQRGGSLEGDAFPQKALNKIPPRIFFVEKDYENWIMIDVSKSRDSEIRSLIPRSISIPYSGDAETFISAFEKILSRSKSYPFLSVLIFNEQGGQYQRIEKVVQKTHFRNVFFLKGGIQAYKKFLEHQTMMKQAKQSSTKTLNKSARCP